MNEKQNEEKSVLNYLVVCVRYFVWIYNISLEMTWPHHSPAAAIKRHDMGVVE